MARPKLPRKLRFNPDYYYFKPRGVPLSDLQEVSLEPDEIEVLKLCDLDDLDQLQVAKQLNVSQPTVGRILDQAHQKIADAIIYGKAIRIKN